MRDKNLGADAVQRAIKNLEKNHQQHIAVYGYALDERLTGAHETCSINEFKSGNSDRGASIRIPIATADKGYGYLEDRRPGANSDPYLVSARILVSVCELSESLMTVNQKTVVKAAWTADLQLTISNLWILIATAIVFIMHLGFTRPWKRIHPF